MTRLAHNPRGGRTWDGWRIARWTVAGTLLLIPALAMQIPDSGWTWSIGDFVFAAVMIGGSGLLYEWAAKRSQGWAYRLGVAVALVACFLLVWINLAVGIVGDPDDPHNAAYFCEVLIAGGTVFTARLRRAAMFRAMLVTGGFQMLVTALAAYAGWGATEPPGANGVLGLNLGFVALWLVSTALFWRADGSVGAD